MIRYSTAAFLLIFMLAAAASAQNKLGCDLVSKADVEALLGSPLQPPQSQAQGTACAFTNFAQGQPQPAKRIDVYVSATYSATANPAALDQFEKRIDETTYGDPVPVPNLSDAAFWINNGSSGDLYAFSGGKTTLLVQGSMTLEQAKAIAAKALGTTAKTGFVYGEKKTPFTKPALGTRPARPTQIEKLKFDLTAKAETGNAKAQFALGNFYEFGMIGPDGLATSDYVAAAYWYQEASNRGEPAASFALGKLYRDGKGVRENDDEALSLFRKAAKAGFVPAMAPLSSQYIVSDIDTKSQRAQQWARAASEAGDPEGDLNMGFMWNKGWLGGGKEYYYKMAMDLYVKSAKGGDCVAMMNIGGLYFNGDGVPQDKTQAESWFAKARSCAGSDLDWMRDKAATYEKKSADGRLPTTPNAPLKESDVNRLANRLISMMSITLGFDVLAPDAEEKASQVTLSDLFKQLNNNQHSLCVLSGAQKLVGC